MEANPCLTNERITELCRALYVSNIANLPFLTRKYPQLFGQPRAPIGDEYKMIINPMWLKLIKDLLGYDFSDFSYEDIHKYDSDIKDDITKLQVAIKHITLQLGK